MKIYRVSALANDLEEAYEGLKRALDHLGRNNIGRTKNEIKKAIKRLEKARPHLKYKDLPVRRKI
jgi:hypothetical protein